MLDLQTPLNLLFVRPFVHLSVCSSVRLSVRPSTSITLRPERALQASVGDRKKPPVGGLNILVYSYFFIYR